MSRHLPVADGMALAKHKNMVLMLSQDLKEAFVSFKEKRKPDFKGRRAKCLRNEATDVTRNAAIVTSVTAKQDEKRSR